jgi:hypothetical protein
MTAWLGRPSMIAGEASSGALTPRSAPTVMAWAGALPPSAESARKALARRIDDGGLLGRGGSVLH